MNVGFRKKNLKNGFPWFCKITCVDGRWYKFGDTFERIEGDSRPVRKDKEDDWCLNVIDVV